MSRGIATNALEDFIYQFDNQFFLRQYGIGAQILADLGLRKIRLMTNNPRKIIGFRSYQIEIVEQVPLEVEIHENNAPYLNAQKLLQDGNSWNSKIMNKSCLSYEKLVTQN